MSGTSQICRCNCGDSAAVGPNGQYLPFAPGHNAPGFDPKKYQADKLKRINEQRARTSAVNAAAQLKREAAYWTTPSPARPVYVMAPVYVPPPVVPPLVVAAPVVVVVAPTVTVQPASAGPSIRNLLK